MTALLLSPVLTRSRSTEESRCVSMLQAIFDVRAGMV